jgi:hypothetical protein
MADGNRSRCQRFAASEVGETGDSESGKNQRREEYADDADSTCQLILQDDHVGDEEWQAEHEEEAAGGLGPATCSGAAAPDFPPRDGVYESDDRRHHQDQFAHADEEDAGWIGMEVRSYTREGRLNDRGDHGDEDQGKDEGDASETSAQNLKFGHWLTRSCRMGISGMRRLYRSSERRRKNRLGLGVYQGYSWSRTMDGWGDYLRVMRGNEGRATT